MNLSRHSQIIVLLLLALMIGETLQLNPTTGTLIVTAYISRWPVVNDMATTVCTSSYSRTYKIKCVYVACSRSCYNDGWVV